MSKNIQKRVIIPTSSWVSNGTYYGAEIVDTDIVSGNSVDVVVSRNSVSLCQNTRFLRETIVSSQQVTVYATEVPSGDLQVTIRIEDPKGGIGVGLAYAGSLLSPDDTATVEYVGTEIAKVANSTTGLAFTLINTDTEYEVSKGTVTTGAVILPTIYNGLPVTKIADDGFKEVTGITSISISNSITDIGAHALDGCTGLTEVVIPNNVTSLGAYAFGGCTGLTGIAILEGMASIGFQAFKNATNLVSVTMYNSTPPTLLTEVFDGTGITASTGAINVLRGSKTTYDTATNWSVFATQIVEYSLVAAKEVSYDNTDSGLSATTVKTAIDENVVAIATKVVKVATGDTKQLYGNAADNTEAMYDIENATPAIDKIPQYGTDGVLKVADGVADGDAASKGQMDTALADKADLVDGTVPSSQLPSYVDDIIDSYIVGATPFATDWLSETPGGSALTPEAGKVYIIITAGIYENKTYRWSGSVYGVIGNDLALGETSSTAYRGDRGKTAYDHSQEVSGNPHSVTSTEISYDNTDSGLTATTVKTAIDENVVAIDNLELTYIDMYYVSKIGSDTNDGKSPSKSFLTIGAAVSVAESGDMIQVVDGGVYTENITIPAGVAINSKLATLAGTLILNSNSTICLYKHLPTADDQTLVLNSGTLHSYYRCATMDNTGFTGITNIKNQTNGAILFVDVELMNCIGRGVQDYASWTTEIGGHIHFVIKDLYLYGSNSRGIDAGSGSSKLVGRVDHILAGTGSSGGTAIYLAADSSVDILAGEIRMEGQTAYNVASGATLNLNCLNVIGTETNAGTALLTASKKYVDDEIASFPDSLLAGTWTQRTSGFGTSYIRSIKYGNGVWTAGGTSGKLATATDPTGTWTQRTSGFGTTSIYNISYGNGVWTAVGVGGKLATATDPTGTWTQRTSGFDTSSIYNIEYGNGVWVAVASDGKLATAGNYKDPASVSFYYSTNLDSQIKMLQNIVLQLT